MAELTLERLMRALPDVMDEETCLAVMGPGRDWRDVPEEWFMTPRELASAILANLEED